MRRTAAGAAGIAVEFAGLTKRFGGLTALDSVDLSIAAGEVHAVVGGNGAGKSTLMKLLAGVERPDAGRILLDGREVRLRDSADARGRGVATVFQELSLFPHLSVAANVFAGREPASRLGMLRERDMAEATAKTLAELGAAIDPRVRVAELSMGQRQLVEIARAVSSGARVAILDEPNSALTGAESERLFDLVRRLRSSGVTVLYVSHRLEEVFSLADRISVLRDGRLAGTWPAAATSPAAVVDAMVGHAVVEVREEHRPLVSGAATLLEVRSLTVPGRLGPMSFSVHAGEVLGVVGLEGSGVDHLFRAVFGLEPLASGKASVGGASRLPRSPAEAVRRGLGLVPRSRREEGLIMGWNVRRNATIVVLSELRGGLGLLDPSRERTVAESLAAELRIITESVEKNVSLLSGGNQQKVVLAKWLAARPRVLLLHDPTRGVDVAAKVEIYALVRRLAAAGLGIVLTSSEIEEVLALSDRVLVLARGRVAEDMPRALASKAAVTAAMALG